MDTKTTKTLLSKLRQPIHISYISQYILRVSEEETRTTLKQLIEENVIEESMFAKDYFLIKRV
tara:strand:- start:4530 stop:4718 length:189 start_codon:yes stop_codon:yes gene_type:complete